ncbi:hypothetical protein ASPVEDRAFT_392938 [Aspergillus versicolor CBS 583.65]|uniref:Uncharacterized protein n=1 Tax=Aspergillus versicolor CBS 583.65 TaxID=1036611 RepID=A0A1L9Q3I0_ASPVE|nr:uncharacterized protein ASPVEDRAFT_392938 [Aspergillus versicolor CBS 583.65]OJJ08278.1 hypothetical protein ASPVEDRAFT_392938 [Aspergillus versicolor CBS 583.65]
MTGKVTEDLWVIGLNINASYYKSGSWIVSPYSHHTIIPGFFAEVYSIRYILHAPSRGDYAGKPYEISILTPINRGVSIFSLHRSKALCGRCSLNKQAFPLIPIVTGSVAALVTIHRIQVRSMAVTIALCAVKQKTRPTAFNSHQPISKCNDRLYHPEPTWKPTKIIIVSI